jgi:hypothetical protein
MNTLIDSLKGSKTYIVVALSIIVTGLLGTGYITQQQYEMIQSILAALGIGFLRAGVKNSVRGTDEPSA